MTFLPLARTILAAVSPLLPASDSSTVRPTPAPVAVVADTTAATQELAVVDTAQVLRSFSFAAPTSAPAAPAAATAPTAPAAPAAMPAGYVPMPAWASGVKTGLLRAAKADSIVVEKGEHRMTLFAGGEAVGTYLVAIGKRSTGAKVQSGDFKTPEGLYHINGRNPNSRFHRALRVSYPNADDIARARALGVSTGGDIMIHGLPNGQGAVGSQHRSFDWTNGCVAVTNEEIEEIWNAVPVGTPIRIKP
jgi:lipoprotein-anchoring transpeptidase ErfK/SrfK